jgi:hypothetical protein
MKLPTWLKRSAPVAANVIGVYNPLVGAILNQIVFAERALPGEKRGEEKKALVLNSITAFLPLLLPMFERAAGRDLVDDAAFADALGDLVDALVRMLKSVNALQTPAA